MKITFKHIALALVVVTNSLLISCKKGPDDPSFSIKTRKARITREWKQVAAKFDFMNTSGNSGTDATGKPCAKTNSENWTVAGVIRTGVSSTTDTCVTTTVSISETITDEFVFNPDGTFARISETTYGNGKKRKIESVGHWDFNDGQGDYSDEKSLLLLNFTKLTGTDTTGNSTSVSYTYGTPGQGSTIAMYIQELRSTKMVLKNSTTITTSSGTSKIEESYTFEPK